MKLIVRWFLLGAAVGAAGCRDNPPPDLAQGKPTTKANGTPVGGLVGTVAPPQVEHPSVPFGTRAEIQQVFWSGDGKWLVTSSKDLTVTIWDANEERPKPPTPLGRHTFAGGEEVAVSGDLLVENTSQKLTVRKISTGEAIRALEGSDHFGGYQPPIFVDNGRRLVGFDSNRREFQVWDMVTGRAVRTVRPTTNRWVNDFLGASPDGQEAYVALTNVIEGKTERDHPDDGIHAVNLETGKTELRIRVANIYQQRLLEGPFGRLLPAANDRAYVGDQVWDLKTGEDLGRKPWPRVDAVDPTGRLLASWARDGDRIVSIWDVASQKRLGGLPRLAVEIQTVAFSPDGRFLAIGGSRDWESRWVPDGRRKSRPEETTVNFAGIRVDSRHVDDRVLLIYDLTAFKRSRILAFPVWGPSDYDEEIDPEIP